MTNDARATNGDPVLPPEVEALVDEILAVEDEAIQREMVDALQQILRIQKQVQERQERRAAKWARLKKRGILSWICRGPKGIG